MTQGQKKKGEMGRKTFLQHLIDMFLDHTHWFLLKKKKNKTPYGFLGWERQTQEKWSHLRLEKVQEGMLASCDTESSTSGSANYGFCVVIKFFNKTVAFILSFVSCSVAQLCLTNCEPHRLQHARFPVLQYLPEFAQTHLHWVSDAFQPSHPLSSPSPPVLNPSQHHGLFQSVGSLHQVAKVLEPQLQHQSFQWIFRVDICYYWLIWSSCCERGSQ